MCKVSGDPSFVIMQDHLNFLCMFFFFKGKKVEKFLTYGLVLFKVTCNFDVTNSHALMDAHVFLLSYSTIHKQMHFPPKIRIGKKSSS